MNSELRWQEDGLNEAYGMGLITHFALVRELSGPQAVPITAPSSRRKGQVLCSRLEIETGEA